MGAIVASVFVSMVAIIGLIYFNRQDKKTADSSSKDASSGKVVPDEEQKTVFEELCGVWGNDPEAERMETEIRNARTSGKTRKIALFD